MKSIFTFFKTHILFFIFSFLALSFLIFQEGYWLYVDTGGWILDRQQYIHMIHNALNSFSLPHYFGVDMTGIGSSRLLQSIFKILPMELYYAIFFMGSYFSMFYLLQVFFPKNISKYGALFYAFNPISLHFLKLVGYLYIYFSVPLILLGIYYFFKTHKFKYLLLLFIGLCFYISYTRLIGIYLLLFILLGFYFYKNIFTLLKRDKKSIFLIVTCTLLILSPFIFSLIYPYIDNNNDYFGGVGNFATVFSQRQIGFIERMRDTSMIYSFFPIEILNDFANDWHQSKIFHIVSLLFIGGNIILFLFSKSRKGLDNFIIYTLLFFIFFHSSPKFLNNEMMISILHYFPFITNNINWLYCIYVILFAYIFTFNLTYIIRKKVLIIGLVVYMFACLFPLLDFKNNIKSQLIDIEKMPIEYKKTFFTKNNDVPNSLFYPQRYLYIKDNPYHIRIRNNLNYTEPFSEDVRLTGDKQAQLSKLLYKTNSLDMLSLFNIKNFFVFKGIQDNNGLLDFYPGKNLEQKGNQIIGKFKNNNSIFLKEENSEFAHFQVKDYNKYEYFLYAPNTILRKNIHNFFRGNGYFDFSQKIINIDSLSFNKPQKIDDFIIPQENKNIVATYKKSQYQPTKIYAKFSNVDIKKSFLVQLNQTFGMSWKIKWISKKEFEAVQCIDQYKDFSLTQNQYCNYKAKILDIQDTRYLDAPSVKEENHFEGNFVGNTWLVEPGDLPENLEENESLYAVIIYEKQIYYTWTLLISGLTLLILLLASIIQETKIYFTKSENKGTLLKK